jgi:hypothetical protein
LAGFATWQHKASLHLFFKSKGLLLVIDGNSSTYETVSVCPRRY